MSRKKLLIIVCAFLSISLVLMGSAPTLSNAEKVLTLSPQAGDLRNMDPHIGNSSADLIVHRNIMSGLVRYKPGLPELEPDLATNIPEPKNLPNGKQEWVFELRKGVRVHPFEGFPNGYELRADDVVYSFQRAANPKMSAHAVELKDIEFEAVDEYKIKFTVEEPISPFIFLPKLIISRGGGIVPKKAAEKLGEEYKTHPVGTGPFMFKEYKPMDRVVMVANKQYFRGKPKLDKLVMKFVSEQGSRERGLSKGELDAVALSRNKEAIERGKRIKGAHSVSFGRMSIGAILMDMSKRPFQDKKVRQAVAYAINREEFLQYFGSPPSYPLYSHVPSTVPGGMAKDEVVEKGLEYKFDLEKAKRLMKEAGMEKGFSLKIFASTRYKDIYELLQGQLRRIGIDLKLTLVDHSAYHSIIRQDANRLVWYYTWLPNAHVYLARFYYSPSIVVTGKLADANFSHYDRVDDMIEKAKAETDPERQVALWKEVYLKSLEDLAGYPVIKTGQVWAVSDRVYWGYTLKGAWFPSTSPAITLNTTIK